MPTAIEKLAFRVHAYAYLCCALVIALAGHIKHRLSVVDQIDELVGRVAHAFRHGDRRAAADGRTLVMEKSVNDDYYVSDDRRGSDEIKSVNDNYYVSGDRRGSDGIKSILETGIIM